VCVHRRYIYIYIYIYGVWGGCSFKFPNCRGVARGAVGIQPPPNKKGERKRKGRGKGKRRKESDDRG
jgi:hypothetical protein